MPKVDRVTADDKKRTIAKIRERGIFGKPRTLQSKPDEVDCKNHTHYKCTTEGCSAVMCAQSDKGDVCTHYCWECGEITEREKVTPWWLTNN